MFLACFSRFAHVLLAFCSRAPAFCRLKAHGIPFAAQCGATFLPFYSAEIGFLSEKRCEVARPQRETRILIENGNAVARPPSQILRVWRIIKKGRWFQKSLFQREFLLYFNRTMGNSCKIMNKITNNLHLHHSII